MNMVAILVDISSDVYNIIIQYDLRNEGNILGNILNYTSIVFSNPRQPIIVLYQLPNKENSIFKSTY